MSGKSWEILSDFSETSIVMTQVRSFPALKGLWSFHFLISTTSSPFSTRLLLLLFLHPSISFPKFYVSLILTPETDLLTQLRFCLLPRLFHFLVLEFGPETFPRLSLKSIFCPPSLRFVFKKVQQFVNLILCQNLWDEKYRFDWDLETKGFDVGFPIFLDAFLSLFTFDILNLLLSEFHFFLFLPSLISFVNITLAKKL